MATTGAKLKNIGKIAVSFKRMGGEILLEYRGDPDNPNARLDPVTVFGFGRGYQGEREALTALARDIRRRGYTGVLVKA